MKINLGSGRKNKKGFVNVDSWEGSSADYKEDCLAFLSRQPDESIEALYSRHFFEHLNPDQLCDYLNEINRVMKDNSRVDIIVPHWSNPAYYSDPTHKSFFGLYTFEYFCERSMLRLPRNIPRYVESNRLVLANCEFRFLDKSIIGRLVCTILNKLFNSSSGLKHFYEERLCRLIPCYEISYKIIAKDDN